MQKFAYNHHQKNHQKVSLRGLCKVVLNDIVFFHNSIEVMLGSGHTCKGLSKRGQNFFLGG